MTLLGLAVVPLPGEPYDVPMFLLAAGVFALVAALIVWVPWHRLPQDLSLLLALAYLVGVGILREAVGGTFGGVGALGMLPVVWMALYGTRAQLAVVIAAMSAMWIGPLLVAAGPSHPVSGWRAAIVFIAMSTMVGMTVQRLVQDVREHAAVAGRLARTDALTALPNRRAWDDALPTRLAAATIVRPLCVALLDLDGFKALNDRLGHHAGDRALKDAAAGWTAELRPGDLLARIGGDEFAVLLVDCDLASATSVVERLRAATPAPLTCSAGLVEHHGGGGGDEVMGRADRLLYQAKQRGRDRTVHEAARLVAV
jgi:diguanylate cyclase (GGDEF)-like protein